MLERAREKEIVGRPLVDADTPAGAIDLLDAAQLRVLRHQIDPLDDHVGRGESDLGGTHRLDRQEGNVPAARLEALEYLAGGLERDELERHVEPPRKLAREIDRDAAWLVRRRVSLHQHRVAEIESGAQRTA